MSGIRFDQAICGDPAESLKREWLETNGLGGFASSTLGGAHTRRYHGLLTAAFEPMIRYLLLSKLEETLVAGTQRYELSTNIYPGVVHPAGYRYLTGFRLDPFPIFTFQVDRVKVEKRVFMIDGENTVVVEYEISSDVACKLELRPLVAFRGYHDLTRKNEALNGAVVERKGCFSIQPYESLPRLYFAHNADAIGPADGWYLNFEYPIERERGLDFHEDLYCPCTMTFGVGPDRPAVVIASTAIHDAAEAPALRASEIRRRQTHSSALLAAADKFIVRRAEHRTVIAGYPWFTDWGRDTMIALPGLTLTAERFDLARQILLEFTRCIDEGMLPNVFPDSDNPPAYNTADATLWFFEAVRQYLEVSGDLSFVQTKLFDRLNEIIEWHVRGTRHGIHMDEDGLVAAGDPTTQLTWMDARVDGKPVTSRHGKAVEIQGLWYNALRFVQNLAHRIGDERTRSRCEQLAARAGKSFNAAFWNEAAGCLYDVIDQEKRDASLRPNQLIALSLGYSAVPEARARRILTVVARSLLTPFGLRTLAPDAPDYRGRLEGPPAQRDAAYHQGTVWPWLMGPYIVADLRFNGDAAHRRAPEVLGSLLRYMENRGTGQIPEIFDGDPPHEPRGCYAQAWSVAEVLRVSALL